MFGREEILCLLLTIQSLCHGSSFNGDFIIVGDTANANFILTKSDHKCSLNPFPSDQNRLFGGKVGNRPTVCLKGDRYTDDTPCYQYINKAWTQTFAIPGFMTDATSVQINNGADMWVAAGRFSSWPDFNMGLNTKTFIVKSPTDILPGIDLPYGCSAPELIPMGGDKVIFVGERTNYREEHAIPVQIIDFSQTNPRWNPLPPYPRERVEEKIHFVGVQSGNENYLYAFVEEDTKRELALSSRILNLKTFQWSQGLTIGNLQENFMTALGPTIYFQEEIYMFGRNVGIKKIQGLRFPLDSKTKKWTPIENTSQNVYLSDIRYNYVVCSGLVEC